MNETEPTGMTVIEVIYKGKVQLTGRKIGVSFSRGRESGADHLYYTAKGFGPLSVGGIYALTTMDGGKGNVIRASLTRYISHVDDKMLVAGWAASAKASEAVINMKYAKMSAAKHDTLAYLEPIHKAYLRSRGVERSVLLAQIVAYITNPED